MKQPEPVVFLAAEIVTACPGVLPGRAAILAEQLCQLGRRYHRIACKIANTGDSDESLSVKLSSLEAKARIMREDLPLTFKRSDLYLACLTVHERRGQLFTEVTTLR